MSIGYIDNLQASNISGDTFYSAGTNLTTVITNIVSSSNQIITGNTSINFGFSSGGEGDYATTAVTNSNVNNNSIISLRLITSIDQS